MCVIITNALNVKAKKIERAELINAYISNPDGFGIVCDNEIMRGKTFAEYSAALDKISGKRFVLWVRISTGGKSLQPFNVGTDETPVYLFHNGICGLSAGNKSDTAILAESLKGANIEDIKMYLKDLNDKQKGKFCLCDENANIIFKVGGETKCGIWRSNTNHISKKPFFVQTEARKNTAVPKVERNAYNHYGSFYK